MTPYLYTGNEVCREIHFSVSWLHTKILKKDHSADLQSAKWRLTRQFFMNKGSTKFTYLKEALSLTKLRRAIRTLF